MNEQKEFLVYISLYKNYLIIDPTPLYQKIMELEVDNKEDKLLPETHKQLKDNYGVILPHKTIIGTTIPTKWVCITKEAKAFKNFKYIGDDITDINFDKNGVGYLGYPSPMALLELEVPKAYKDLLDFNVFQELDFETNKEAKAFIDKK